MTKFMKMGQDSPIKEAKKKKKTVFNRLVCSEEIICADSQPTDYERVMFLWRDAIYGDVFLAWNIYRKHSRMIYFGEKGDEFDEL